MRRIATALLGAFAVLSAPALAAEYRIDEAHSFIRFRTMHLGMSWLVGGFNEFSGSFTYDPDGGPGAQSIEITVDIASIDSNHSERDKHLLGSGFLDVGKFSEARFVSTGYAGDADGGVMSGDLTLHGVTLPVEVEVKRLGEGEDPWGGYRAGFEGRMVISRSDFGVDRNMGPEAEMVEVEVFVEGVRK